MNLLKDFAFDLLVNSLDILRRTDQNKVAATAPRMVRRKRTAGLHSRRGAGARSSYLISLMSDTPNSELLGSLDRDSHDKPTFVSCIMI